MNLNELKEFLDEKHLLYNRKNFISSDPISIPRQFSKKEDIEIAAFLVATIAWGKRSNIINNAEKLMLYMGNSPHEFIIQHHESDLKPFQKFVHRTFNGIDCQYFIRSLRNIYVKHGGLEKVFCASKEDSATDTYQFIVNFRKTFFELQNYPKRTEKHVSNPTNGSSCKRINMFLRWMVRKDNKGVDFGIWNNITSKQLMCPLDVHTGNVSRKLGLISRSQNDWKACLELTNTLKKLDPDDPVKYDFALFGLGVFENF